MAGVLDIALPGLSGLDIVADNLDDAAILGELEGIGLQVHQHLLDPLLIGLDQQVLVFNGILLHWEVVELRNHINVLGLRLVELNGDDLLNTALDAESLDDLGKFAGLQLSEAQNILNVKEQEVGTAGLDLVSLVKRRMEVSQLLEHKVVYQVCICLHEHKELLADYLDDFALVDD